MTTGPACDLRGISRRFDKRWALRGITFQVAPGEIVGVMGHNGSGKSTLLRVVSTALKPSLGTGQVFGHDIVRQADAVRAQCGFLAHAPGIYDDLTARENLRFAALMYAIDASPIDAILDRVGLWRERDERVRGFSAGMQRRLSLGRLLLQRPMLLLLDEPYNNFDPAGVALLNDVILDTRDRGGAALVVLHDRRQAAALLDRIIELERGGLRAAMPESDEAIVFAAVRIVAEGGGGGR
jgi:heme exporter protein A